MKITSGIKRRILRFLNSYGYQVFYVPQKGDKRLKADIPDRDLYRPHFSPWLDRHSSNEFARMYRQANPKSLVTAESAWVIYSLAKQALVLDGDYCEFGVYKGGSAYLLLELIRAEKKNRPLHLFDTFSEMPESTQHDYHQKGDFSDTSLANVQKFLNHAPECQYYPGLIPDTFSGASIEKIAFAHIDLDLYQSVWDAILFVMPRLVRGGFVIFDDYGYATCVGARKAINEYYASTNCVPLVLPTGQAIVFKSNGDGLTQTLE